MRRQFIWGLGGLGRLSDACSVDVNAGKSLFGDSACSQAANTHAAAHQSAHLRLGSVVTIGSFDGVHLGHQQILARVVSRAKAEGLVSVAMIFEPQPHEYFAHDRLRPRIMRLRDKVMALLAEGIDQVVCLRFNQQLRELTATAFIDDVLLRDLKVRHLEIGDDFRFGCDRSGDFALLQQVGEREGFTVANSETFEQDNERVSSTRIREVLGHNQLAHAEALLGKPYAITGRVVYGQQLGRTLGVPTANLGLGRYPSVLSGVYAVRVQLSAVSVPLSAASDAKVYQGVANVGVKPTVAGERKPMLEIHLFDFTGDLYGQLLTVTFAHFIREEQKFPSLDALKQQIYNDCATAKRLLN